MEQEDFVLNDYFNEIQKDFEYELKHEIKNLPKELNGKNFFEDLYKSGELETFLKHSESKKRKVLKLWIKRKCNLIFSSYSEKMSKLINRPFPEFTLQYSLRHRSGKDTPSILALVLQKRRLK